MKISIIVPVYFNEKNLHPLYETLKKDVFSKIDCDYELIFIDDGSTDDSYKIMCELAEGDSHIKLIKLSRNFGSHAAILAGYTYCTGDCATSISADLQDPPEIILMMLERWKQGNKVVLAVREDREEPLSQKIFSNTYYAMMKKFAIPNMPSGGFDCSLVDRQVINMLNLMEEKNTTIMGQILWCGFKTDTIYYVRKKRDIGESRWTLSKKVKLFIDSFLSFSYAPIRFISIVGFIFFAVAIIWSIYIVVMKINGQIALDGWSTLVVLNLFSFGIIMTTLGIIGEYLWRVFDTARKRPPFIIEETKF